jgi:2-phosphoglycerate kinase
MFRNTLSVSEDSASPVIASTSRREPCHRFWDEIDKLIITDFKTEVLLDLVDRERLPRLSFAAWTTCAWYWRCERCEAR